jgi:hypothetical protein
VTSIRIYGRNQNVRYTDPVNPDPRFSDDDVDNTAHLIRGNRRDYQHNLIATYYLNFIKKCLIDFLYYRSTPAGNPPGNPVNNPAGGGGPLYLTQPTTVATSFDADITDAMLTIPLHEGSSINIMERGVTFEYGSRIFVDAVSIMGLYATDYVRNIVGQSATLREGIDEMVRGNAIRNFVSNKLPQGSLPTQPTHTFSMSAANLEAFIAGLLPLTYYGIGGPGVSPIKLHDKVPTYFDDAGREYWGIDEQQPNADR